MPLKTTFFWNYPAFSGTSQLNLGPFFIGFVNKLYKVQVRGQVNYQGVTLGSSSVLANFLAWGLLWVPHTAAATDVITSADDETWISRRQTGDDDYPVEIAPSSGTSGVLLTNAINDDWAGQLAIAQDADLWMCFKSSTGASISNLNTFGTVRLWWN